MAYFKDGQKTKRVKLPSVKSGKYWVEIRPDVKWGQSKHALTVKDDGTIDMVMSADRLLNMLIVAWNLDDKEGKVLEISEENVDQLEPQDAMYLINIAGGDQVSIEQAKKNLPKA
jgi:homoaconitase/3-isopropylmalate dehydratase large subunit